MKMYNNGQRQAKMYGGGMAVRKPMMYGGTAMKKKKMQMGGLAEKNKAQAVMTPKTRDSMGMMTDQKKFGMGYKYGGKLVGGQKKLDKNNDGKISGKDFKMMRKG